MKRLGLFLCLALTMSATISCKDKGDKEESPQAKKPTEPAASPSPPVAVEDIKKELPSSEASPDKASANDEASADEASADEASPDDVASDVPSGEMPTAPSEGRLKKIGVKSNPRILKSRKGRLKTIDAFGETYSVRELCGAPATKAPSGDPLGATAKPAKTSEPKVYEIADREELVVVCPEKKEKEGPKGGIYQVVLLHPTRPPRTKEVKPKVRSSAKAAVEPVLDDLLGL